MARSVSTALIFFNVSVLASHNGTIDLMVQSCSHRSEDRLLPIDLGDPRDFDARASCEYDALGRLIYSWTQLDPNTGDSDDQALWYYHDGPNVIAEYTPALDPGDKVLPRRHIHGTARVDERAVLIEGHLGVPIVSPQPTAECYYYLLQDLDTVAGLMKQNGNLAEVHAYRAYGKATRYHYPRGDFNRNGFVTQGDVAIFVSGGLPQSGVPTNDPTLDLDLDGDKDAADQSLMQMNAEASTERVSCIGNPYAFTGRRLFYYETEPDPNGEGGVTLLSNEQLQFNRNRWYDLETSRWLTRDPKGYADGMSLYEYCKSNPARNTDPMGTESVEKEGDWLTYVNAPFFGPSAFSWRFGLTLADGNILVDHPNWPLAFVMREDTARSALDPALSSHGFRSPEEIMLLFSGMALNSGEQSLMLGVLDKRKAGGKWAIPADLDLSDPDLVAIGRAAQGMNLAEVASLTASSYGLVYGSLTLPAGYGATVVDLLDTAVETGRGGVSPGTIVVGAGTVTLAILLHTEFAQRGRRVAGAGNELDDAFRFPKWRPGGSITQALPDGSYPAWHTYVRADKAATIQGRYWINRAKLAAEGEFASSQLTRMAGGFAPERKALVRLRNGDTAMIWVKKGLHHARGSRGVPGFDEPSDLREVWPWEHAGVDPNRHLHYDFIKFLD